LATKSITSPSNILAGTSIEVLGRTELGIFAVVVWTRGASVDSTRRQIKIYQLYSIE